MLVEDIIDLGLVSHFLGADIGAEDVVSAASHDGACTAFASREVVVLMRREAPTSPTLLHAPGEHASAVVCLTVPAAAAVVAVVGYRSGALAVWSCDGSQLLRLHLHNSPLVQLAAQTLGGGDADGGTLLCLWAGGALCHVCAATLGEALTSRLASSGEGRGGRAATERLAACFRLLSVGERPSGGGWVGVASGGQLPSPPLEVDAALEGGRGEAERGREPPSLGLTLTDGASLQLHLVTVATAEAPPPAAADADAAAAAAKVQAAATEATSGRVAAVALGSSLGSGALSLFSLVTESIEPKSPALASSLEATAGRVAAVGSTVASRLAAPPSGAPETAAVRTWSDGGRVFEAVWPDPRKRYVAASDSLGRVLLLERATLVQLRVWKGYRSVQCGWLDALAPGGGLRAVLAIHAPRRELVEMWAVPAGVRLRAIATGPGCQLLAPAPPLAQAEEGGAPLRCYLLQPSGALSRLEPTETCDT